MATAIKKQTVTYAHNRQIEDVTKFIGPGVAQAIVDYVSLSVLSVN